MEQVKYSSTFKTSFCWYAVILCVCTCINLLPLSLSLSSFPLPYFTDSDQYQLGAVQSLEWSPIDYSVLAVAWTNGGLSMWSVFGSLLFHSLGNQPGLVIYSVSLSFPLSSSLFLS